jgi:hypothetical protein
MDIIPTMVDGAVVLSLSNPDLFAQDNKKEEEEEAVRVVINIHNWVKQIKLEYLVFDFQEEKHINQFFLVELMQLRKRLRIPFLFSGVLNESKKTLESYSCQDSYPLFWTPNDAIRALRIQHPGITENNAKHHVTFGESLSEILKNDIKPNIKEKKQKPKATSQDYLSLL